MNTKAKITVISITALVAGYVAGSIFGLPQVSHGMGSGDISKVSKYYKTSANSSVSAYQEKLLNDAEALQEACISMEVLTSRMNDFSALVDRSIQVAEGKEEFKNDVNALKSVKNLSDNAVETGKIASVSFQSLLNGETNDLSADYEQVAQNLAVAYLMVDRQVSLGKQFVSTADLYLRRNSIEDNYDLALLRDLWADYCAGSAYLNNNNDEMAYWNKKECLLSADQVSKSIENQAQKTLENQAQKAVENQAQKAVENMAQKAVENQAQKSVENAAQKSVENMAQKSIEQMAQKHIENMAQKSIIDIAQKTIENQAQKTVENQAQKVLENMAQKSVENQAQKSVENAAQKSVENQAQKAVENAAQKTLENQAQKTVENQAQKQVENQLQKALENAAQKTVENQVQKAVENAAQKAIENQAQKSVGVLVQKSLENMAQKNLENTLQQKF